jgi:hypothetical protein
MHGLLHASACGGRHGTRGSRWCRLRAGTEDEPPDQEAEAQSHANVPPSFLVTLGI